MKNPRSRGKALGNRFPIKSYVDKSTFKKPIKKALMGMEQILGKAAGFRDKYIHPLTTGQKITKLQLKQLSQSRRNQMKKDYGL